MNPTSSIRILSAGAPKTGVRLCAEAYCESSGSSFTVEFATAPAIKERAGRGTVEADIVVAPVPAMSAFVEDGHIVDRSVVRIGAVAAGVVVRAGAATPDVSTPETFRAALLQADALVYNQASSGEYIAEMIEKLGIAADVAGKTVRVANGRAVMEYIAADRGERTIGFGQVTEIRLHQNLGVRLVGPLPATIGKVTEYAAGLSPAGIGHAGAAALVAFMASSKGQAIFKEAGIIPK
jgi:molybdate transport system substrate-binding protein